MACSREPRVIVKQPQRYRTGAIAGNVPSPAAGPAAVNGSAASPGGEERVRHVPLASSRYVREGALVGCNRLTESPWFSRISDSEAGHSSRETPREPTRHVRVRRSLGICGTTGTALRISRGRASFESARCAGFAIPRPASRMASFARTYGFKCRETLRGSGASRCTI